MAVLMVTVLGNARICHRSVAVLCIIVSQIIVDKSVDIIVRALYGAAACMIKTAGNKKKSPNDWFNQECVQMKKWVTRQLRQFQRASNHGERNTCKIHERI